MAGAFTLVVKAVFRKFDGKAVIGGLMKACYKPFYELARKQFQASSLF